MAKLVVVKAWFAARRVRPDMNLLMAVAVIGAAAIGDTWRPTAVSFAVAGAGS
jgi:Cd2+/Zn2+-exporting ATPase